MSEEKQITLPVMGMTCANCVAAVERNTRKVAGVSEANVNFASEKVTLTYDPAVLKNPQEVIDRIRRAGYDVPTATVELVLTGMTCANCATNIERALNKVDGVLEANVNLASEKAFSHGRGGHGNPGRSGRGGAQGRLRRGRGRRRRAAGGRRGCGARGRDPPPVEALHRRRHLLAAAVHVEHGARLRAGRPLGARQLGGLDLPGAGDAGAVLRRL
jgi:copper ion binding protein